MTGDLARMSEMPGPDAFLRAVPLTSGIAGFAAPPAPIGVVYAIAGSSSRVLLDRASIGALCDDPDSVVAAAGQVGSQVKMRVGTTWLVANVRSLKLEDNAGTCIAAEIDFLGEGDEDGGERRKARRGSVFHACRSMPAGARAQLSRGKPLRPRKCLLSAPLQCTHSSAG